MNIKELKAIIANIPDDTEIVIERHSDYALVDEHYFIKGVDKNGWIMRTHPTMSEENKVNEKEYFLLN